jgi:hypothetical protein
MKLHNPKNLNLPPLKVERSGVRVTMESSVKVSNFIKTNLLLDRDFQELFLDLCARSQEVEDMTRSFEAIDHPLKPGVPAQWFRRRGGALRHSLNTFSLLEAREHLRTLSKEERMQKHEAKMVILRQHFKDLVSRIKRASSSIENRLSRFEDSRKMSLDILTSMTLFACRDCRKLLSKDRFSSGKCVCGKTIRAVSGTTKIPIAYLDRTLRNFITQNYWLEHGIDYILRRKNFQTLCGYSVLGHSGFLHEIDNIAESTKDTFRFFCECKAGPVKPADVFILAGKMGDIGCSRGYIFSLEKNVPKEVVHLARSRNISIVTAIAEKTETQLLQEIRE